MKYLIVNAEEFGAGRGVNRGIIEAHRHGILTSASLLVNTPWSEEAATLSLTAPGLSVGLHVDLRHNASHVARELHEQFERFLGLLGRPPTHLDSHHNVHRNPQLLPEFLALAQAHHLPLREHSPVHYCPKFCGHTTGRINLEQIKPAALVRLLKFEIKEGVTELDCHPGFAEPGHAGGHAEEPEIELRTLCDPAVHEAVVERGIELINYRDLDRVVAMPTR